MALNINSSVQRIDPTIVPSVSRNELVGSNPTPQRPAVLKTDVGLAINPEPVLHAPAVVDKNKEQNIRNAIDQINTVLKDGGRGISFVMDKSLSTPIVQVTRDDTGEVLCQYPNEAIIRVAHSIESLKGVLYQGLI
jgi:uncharacterized FlaG/YvyC family protein